MKNILIRIIINLLCGMTQLNFVVFCVSSACGVSVEHMNAKKPMIRSIYRFHIYYHIRRILKILEISLSYENSFNQYNNPYKL